MSKSALYVANTSTQLVAVDGIINLGNIVRRFGCGANLSGNNIVLDEVGYYDVNVSITASPTAIGTVTATLFNNGVAVVGGNASQTVTVADDTTNLSFESVVRVFCGANAGSLSLVLTGTESNVSNVAVTVKKL